MKTVQMIDIQRLLDDYNIEQKQLALDVERSGSYINQIIHGKKKTPAYIVNSLSKLTGLTEKEIRSKYAKSGNSSVHYLGRMAPVTRGVKMTIVPATSIKGFAQNFTNDPEIKTDYMYHRFQTPVIAFEITSSTMQESFKPGDYAICDEDYITNIDKLEDDTVYVIITDTEYLLRRVKKEDDKAYIINGDERELINGNIQRCYKVLSRDTRYI